MLNVSAYVSPLNDYVHLLGIMYRLNSHGLYNDIQFSRAMKTSYTQRLSRVKTTVCSFLKRNIYIERNSISGQRTLELLHTAPLKTPTVFASHRAAGQL